MLLPTRAARDLEYPSVRGLEPIPLLMEATLTIKNLGLVTLCASFAIAGCGDDGNTGGSGGSPAGGSAQGAGPQGAGSQGGDGPTAGAGQGGDGQGAGPQGGDGQRGTAQGGSGTGGAAQGGNGSGGNGSGGDGSGGDGTGGAPPALTCQTACEVLFDCALEDDSSGEPNCPGLEPSDGAVLIPGCVQQCNNNMALIAIVDPSDCEGTIDTVTTVNPTFDNVCENGI
jgi:hypothetical protein